MICIRGDGFPWLIRGNKHFFWVSPGPQPTHKHTHLHTGSELNVLDDFCNLLDMIYNIAASSVSLSLSLSIMLSSSLSLSQGFSGKLR